MKAPALAALFFAVFGFGSTIAAPADPARKEILQALSTGVGIPGQASNLAALAWPSGHRDETVSVRARGELVNFGSYAIDALTSAINTVKISYTEEVVATTLEAQHRARGGKNREYVPILIDALWTGSHGAKVLAIRSLASNRNAIAVAPMIDSAIADPSLAPDVLEALGSMRYQQARFYLETVMMEGPPSLRPLAASSLSQIGGAALGPLKKALKAQNREARLLAARALLPAATEYEVGALYEYVEKYGSDDPNLTQAIKLSTAAIEKAIAARDASQAADSPKDF